MDLPIGDLHAGDRVLELRGTRETNHGHHSYWPATVTHVEGVDVTVVFDTEYATGFGTWASEMTWTPFAWHGTPRFKSVDELAGRDHLYVVRPGGVGGG